MTFSLTHLPVSFRDSVDSLLRRVECRPALAQAEKNEIYRLRYAAYRREKAIPLDAPHLFSDRFDDLANTMTFGLYVEGRLASSIRIHLVSKRAPEHPGLNVFGDHLWPLIDAGEVLIDPTRFVVDYESSRRHPKLPYATVRVAWMASEWFGADRLLATVRSEHQAFYKRLMGHEVVCEPRSYPPLTKKLSLMMLDFKSGRDGVLKRYPFLQSTSAEREMLFGRWSWAQPALDMDRIALVA